VFTSKNPGSSALFLQSSKSANPDANLPIFWFIKPVSQRESEMGRLASRLNDKILRRSLLVFIVLMIGFMAQQALQ
jgi:hypothetical protein